VVKFISKFNLEIFIYKDMNKIRKIIRKELNTIKNFDEFLNEDNTNIEGVDRLHTDVDRLHTEHGFIDIAYTNDYGDFNLIDRIPIIMYIQIYSADNVNKGYGQELYLKALDKYKVLYSDAPNTNAKYALNSLEIKDLIETETVSFNGNNLTKITPR